MDSSPVPQPQMEYRVLALETQLILVPQAQPRHLRHEVPLVVTPPGIALRKRPSVLGLFFTACSKLGLNPKAQS